MTVGDLGQYNTTQLPTNQFTIALHNWVILCLSRKLAEQLVTTLLILTNY